MAAVFLSPSHQIGGGGPLQKEDLQAGVDVANSAAQQFQQSKSSPWLSSGGCCCILFMTDMLESFLHLRPEEGLPGVTGCPHGIPSPKG